MKKILKIVLFIVLIFLSIFGIKHLFVEGNFSSILESIKSEGFIKFILDFFKNFFVA